MHAGRWSDDGPADCPFGPDDCDSLHACLARLEGIEPRQAVVVRLKFGIGGNGNGGGDEDTPPLPPMANRDIGSALGVTRARAEQILDEALMNLRLLMDGKGVARKPGGAIRRYRVDDGDRDGAAFVPASTPPSPSPPERRPPRPPSTMSPEHRRSLVGLLARRPDLSGIGIAAEFQAMTGRPITPQAVTRVRRLGYQDIGPGLQGQGEE
jgi:hypothetical protein